MNQTMTMTIMIMTVTITNIKNVKYLMGARGGKRIVFSNKEGGLGYLDRNYQIVIPPLFAKARPFNEGVAWVRH